MKYDFGGWATRNDLQCADGRVIKKDAFKGQNGQTVPLVWMHNHADPANVLGLAHLENRDEGVYAFCEFNDTESGKTARELVKHGDVQSLSIFQTGGVYNSGTAWNGLSTVTESPSGAEPTAIYADNIKYLNLMSAEEFGGTIEAYMAPDEFAECDGSKEIAPGVFAGQQNRKMFGLSYKTLLGNDVDSNDYGYKLHLVYGCLASPSEKGYSTVNDSPEAITLSWEFSTTPVEIATLIDGKKLKPTSILTFDSTKVDAKKLAALEEILYGKDPSSAEADDGVEPRLPLPDEVIKIMTAEG